MLKIPGYTSVLSLLFIQLPHISVLVILSHPLLDLGHLGFNHLHHPPICTAVSHNQIRRVEAARNHQHGLLGSRFHGSAGSASRRYARFSPWVVFPAPLAWAGTAGCGECLPVAIEESRGVPLQPSARPAVDIFGSPAFRAAIRMAVDLGEEQRALPLEEIRVDHARYERGFPPRRGAVSW